MPINRNPIIPCSLNQKTRQVIEEYSEALRKNAPDFAPQGLSEDEFWRAGLFRSAIERIRGQQSASMQEKRDFMSRILNYLKTSGVINYWEFKGTRERFDYEIILSSRRTIIIETKGCLDGNNTNIFVRPPHADEFYIWSLCQNPGSDPQHNAWSGIHTRLSAEIIHRRELVDGVIIWDMLCGTVGRPCPKLAKDNKRATVLNGIIVPPPCLYLLSKSLPDPRNNPSPHSWNINELSFASAIYGCFKCDNNDVTNVYINTRMEGPEIQRQTIYIRDKKEISRSNWTTIRRSR